MAGSLISVSYLAFAGTFIALRRDESNSRGTIGIGTATTGRLPCFLPAADPFVGSLPGPGFKPRRVNAQLQSNPSVRRSFPVGNIAAFNIGQQVGATVLASITANEAPVFWNITSVVGESLPRNISFTGQDTGQTDGTVGSGVAGA